MGTHAPPPVAYNVIHEEGCQMLLLPTDPVVVVFFGEAAGLREFGLRFNDKANRIES